MSNTPRVFVSHCSHDDNHADTVVNILRQIVPAVEIKHYRDPNLQRARSKFDSDKILQDADVFLILYSKQYEDSDPSMRELENGYHRDVKRELEMVIVKLDNTRLPSVMQGRDYISSSDPDLSIKLTKAVQAAASRVRAHQAASQTPPPTTVAVVPQRPPPISKTREARENPDARWHGSTRDIQTLGDWTIHFHPAGVMWRDEAFKEVVQNRAKVVPAKLLYASYEGTQAWLNKCAASSYRFYNASYDLLKNRIEGIIDEAKSRSGDPEFDFISLGCGNGYKDACILHSMVNHLDPNDPGQFIYYYPIDVSPFMLMAASTNIFNHELGNLATNKLRVKGLWGDFAYLNAFSGVYEEFKKNNFIAVLGNTIGNECEIDVLNALQDGTFPGDFVLIEYNAQDSAQLYAKDFSTKANIERHWEALLRLDSKATYGTLDARELQRSDAGKSFLAEHSFTTYATDVKFTRANGRAIKELGLALLHSYDRGRIGDKMVEKGFEIISNDVERGVGLLFARKL